MKTSSFLPLTPLIKTVTVIGSILILGGIALLVYEWMQLHTIHILFVALLLVVVTLASICIIPRKVVVNQDGINIHLLAWTIHIPADEVVKVEHYPYGIKSHRIVGAGGFFGNLGLFTCQECGKHLSLITDPKDVCIITRKSKMPIAVSIADNSVFNTISKVQEKN